MPPSLATLAISPAAFESLLLSSSAAEVSAAANATAEQLAALSGAALEAAQSTLLDSLASAVSTNVSANSEGAATLVLAVVTAVPGAVLSAATQASALTVLAAVAAAPQNVSSTQAQSVTSALSAVATSAAATGGTSAAMLSQVHTVLESLTATTAASLSAQQLEPGAALSTTTTSPTIQMRVQLDPPGSDRLTTQTLTAPGSPSAFEPMPAGLLDSSRPVVTSFFSLAFDPYAGAPGATLATTGVTRLAFSNPDGSPIPVENATVPIRFTLPAVDVSDPDAQATCAFWDTAAQPPGYSTRGCAGVPSPYPPGHNVSFLENFTAASDAELVMAWNISGPMVNDGTCFVAVLDCGADNPGPYFVDSRTRQLVLSQYPAVLYPDPYHPLDVPAISCSPPGDANAPPPRTLRVYYGTDCALWRPDNAFNCSWNNTKQAFEGSGCIGGDATRCMCRHLTDFASARVPKIETCSLSDMTSFSAADIVSKLKFLFILVITMFGAMNVGAVVALVLDVRERRATLARLMRPESGFTELPGDVWVWRCVQEPLARAVQAPTGSAVQLAAIFGLPFVRLRAALPEVLFAGTVGQATGRRAGLSAKGLEETHEENVKVMTQLMQGLSCFGAARSRIPATGPLDDDDAGERGAVDPAKPPEPTPRLTRTLGRVSSAVSKSRDSGVPPDALAEEMVGTALVLAFMENAKTLPVVALAHRVATARAHFSGCMLTVLDHDFDALRRMFLVMLSPGNLSSRTDWLEKSRLWRFIMLQRADGGWDMSQSLAFALQAHNGARPPPPPPQSKLRTIIGALLGDDDFDDAFDDAIEDVMTSSDDEDEVTADPAAAALPQHVADCPLTFSRFAIEQRLPAPLAVLNHDYEQQQAELAELARLRQLAQLQREMASLQPMSPQREQSAKHLAAAAEAAMRAQRSALLATPHSVWSVRAELLSLVDSALLSLQQEATMFRQLMATGTPRSEAQLRRLQAGERSTSRRLQRLVTLRVSLPPAATAPPSLEATPTAAGSAPASFADASVGNTPHGDGTVTPFSVARATQQAGAPKRHVRKRLRIPVERIWATLLAMGVLEEMDSCWLTDEAAETVNTVVDAGRAFLEAQGRASRRLRKLLKSGTLQAASERARKDWKAIQAHHVLQLREQDVVTRFTALTHIQRASARIVRSLMTDHSTFATFLDTDGYIMRWQRWMILITLVLSTLLTSIWFYYSRGAQCCAEIRAILGCDPAGPCRGFAGDCADILAQFNDVQGPYLYSVGVGEAPTEHMYLNEYVCHAFPDDAYVTDQLFVGLISVAVALPVDLFLARAFEIANEGETPENWLDAPGGKWKLLLGKDLHNGWHLADPARPVKELALHLILNGDDALSAIAFLIASALCRLRARVFGGGDTAETDKGGSVAANSGAPSEASSSEARANAIKKRLYASAGLLGVYVCWTIFSWFIFTYGMLIYRQLGSSAQEQFAQSWGVGCALNNASEWQDVAKTALQTALVLVVLDLLRLTKNSSWFEEHVDFVSLQAVLFNSAARSWWAQTRTLIKLQARLTDD